MRKKLSNIAGVIIAGSIIAAFMVADTNLGVGLMAIAVGIAVFVAIIDKDFRGKF